MKRFIFAAAVTMAMLVGPAVAQKGGMSQGGQKTPLDLQYERERQAQEENERAYNETMKRLKSQAPTTGASDPWASVRPANDSKSKR
jgi:hypothetical protein